MCRRRSALWLTLALLAPVHAVAADSSSYQLRNAADLVKVCSVAADHPLHANALGFCHGVLTGAYRYYEATAAGKSRFVCAPTPTPTRSAVMSGFVQWAGRHAERMQDPPIDTLFRYLGETYPCKS
jgi:hypothetical protein